MLTYVHGQEKHSSVRPPSETTISTTKYTLYPVEFFFRCVLYLLRETADFILVQFQLFL